MQRSSAGLRYLAAALCCGLIAIWGSENLFWTVPRERLAPQEWLLTWGAYSLVSAAALSAVLWSGLGGWRAGFLGGCLLGFGVEGVVVATMYDAFPAQLVWTPLAWHGLITGLCVLALPRALARGPLWRQIAGLAALGVFGAVWGLYWPTERPQMPGLGTALAYLPGLGLTMVLAHVGLDRLGPLATPSLPVLCLAPAVLAAAWLLRLVLQPSPVLLACPALIAATVWAMRRLGRPGTRLDPGPRLPVWRHALLLLAPCLTAVLVVPGWAAFGPVSVNIPVALTTGLAGLSLWLWLMAAALRAGRRRQGING